MKTCKGGVLLQSGMIGVVHTFGRNIWFNPHVHALVPKIKTRVTKLRIWNSSTMSILGRYGSTN